MKQLLNTGMQQFDKLVNHLLQDKLSDHPQTSLLQYIEEPEQQLNAVSILLGCEVKTEDIVKTSGKHGVCYFFQSYNPLTSIVKYTNYSMYHGDLQEHIEEMCLNDWNDQHDSSQSYPNVERYIEILSAE